MNIHERLKGVYSFLVPACEWMKILSLHWFKGLLILENHEQITAGNGMVGTAINLAQGLLD